MRVLVPVRRVIEENVKVRVRADGSRVDLVNIQMSPNSFHEVAVQEASQRATLVNGQPPILGPHGQRPRWHTVSISAHLPAVADALSTAFCLMDRPAIDRALNALPGARLEVLA